MRGLGWLRPVAFIAVLLVIWQVAISRHPDQLLPGPWQTARGIGELLHHGLLLKYVVASLFRVTWGFVLAAVSGDPVGTGDWVVSPGGDGVQSAAADFSADFSAGVDSDRDSLVWSRGSAAIFLIFVGCFFPLLLTAINAVHNIPAVYINAGRNFGLRPARAGLSGVVSGGDAATDCRVADHAGGGVAGRGGGGDDRG